MFSVIFIKELRAILQSPKFVATFAVCSVLILLSVYIGIREYKAAVTQYELATAMNLDEAAGKRSWGQVVNRVYREPDPMQIFVSGVNFDVGRYAPVNSSTRAGLTSSHYSEEPLYAVFRFIDFSFIVLIVLSLMAIVFTYDAVSGEREEGTLKLIFSNGVNKATYLLAKATGTMVAMVVPLLIPIFISLLLLQLMEVPMSGSDWGRVLYMIGTSLLYFVSFICLGLLVSTLTRNSNVSFLVLLVAWVVIVLVLPRLSILAANQIVHVPTVAEVESQLQGFSKEEWTKHGTEIQKRWTDRMTGLNTLDPAEREAERQKREWAWMEQDDSLRNKVRTNIEEYTRNIFQDLNNRKAAQARLALTMSRISPASAYQLAAMSASYTDPGMKARYEEALGAYRERYMVFLDEQNALTGASGSRISFSMGPSGFNISQAAQEAQLDVSLMPEFVYDKPKFGHIVDQTYVDLLIILGFSAIGFLGAYFAFVRYDVR